MKWFTAIGLLLTSVMHVTAQDSTDVVPAVEVVQISGMVVTGDSLAPVGLCHGFSLAGPARDHDRCKWIFQHPGIGR